MMPSYTTRTRKIELALIFLMILVLFLLSLLAPADPTPPTTTPWNPGAIDTHSPTPTAAPAWWQDFPTPFSTFPTPKGDAHVTPTKP